MSRLNYICDYCGGYEIESELDSSETNDVENPYCLMENRFGLICEDGVLKLKFTICFKCLKKVFDLVLVTMKG